MNPLLLALIVSPLPTNSALPAFLSTAKVVRTETLRSADKTKFPFASVKIYHFKASYPGFADRVSGQLEGWKRFEKDPGHNFTRNLVTGPFEKEQISISRLGKGKSIVRFIQYRRFK